MPDNSSLIIRTLPLAALFALAACGGGGSSTPPALNVVGTSENTYVPPAAAPAPAASASAPAPAASSPAPAPSPAPSNVYLVNPAASWMKLSASSGDSYGTQLLTSVSLKNINGGLALSSGAVLNLTPAGEYTYDDKKTLGSNLAVVFVGADGKFIPATGTTPAPALSADSCKIPTPPANETDDFGLDYTLQADGQFATSQVAVPTGAVAVQLSVNDCFFSDNAPSSTNPLRVTLTLTNPS